MKSIVVAFISILLILGTPLYAQTPEGDIIVKTEDYGTSEKDAHLHLNEVLNYNPDYIEAYVLQGNMNYTVGARISRWKLNMHKLDQVAQNAYETAARKSLNKDFQAMMYHKIGTVYDELARIEKKSKSIGKGSYPLLRTAKPPSWPVKNYLIFYYPNPIFPK